METHVQEIINEDAIYMILIMALAADFSNMLARIV